MLKVCDYKYYKYILLFVCSGSFAVKYGDPSIALPAIGGDGSLRLKTAAGEIVEQIPQIEQDGKLIDGRFKIQVKGDVPRRTVNFNSDSRCFVLMAVSEESGSVLKSVELTFVGA